MNNKYIFVGNANTGKTTIFNLLTSSHEHTGNWHGVTINEKEKSKLDNIFVDLPGLYSLDNCFGLEEENAIEYLNKNKNDIILNVVDANNLRRNLFLTLQLIDKGYKVCLLVNFIKDAKKNKLNIDYDMLSQMLGVNIVQIDTKNKNKILKSIENCSFLNKKYNFQSEEDIYNKIDEICFRCIKNNTNYGLTKIDKLLLNKWLSIPLFILIMLLIFFLTFSSVGTFFSGLIRNAIESIINLDIISVTLKENNYVLYSFVVECLLNGVANILCFLPQIVLLHFSLNILEESGYISRLAFLLEDLFSLIGLSGKSIFTLLMGFGCSATAISTSANMTNKRARNKLVLLTPNISCSAKLPIYLVIGSAFFGVKNIFIIFGLYILGIFILTIQALILNKLHKTEETFILEFPKLRFPNFKNVILNCFKTAFNFITKVGSTILVFTIIIWFLQHFTINLKFTLDISNSMLKHIASFLQPLFLPLGFTGWGIVVCLISGLVAKEMVLSTICLLNGVGIDLIAQSLTNGVVSFNNKTALIFLVFCLIYSPCMSTFAMQKHIAGTRIALTSLVMQFIFAFVVCMFLSTILNLISFWQTFLVLTIVTLVIFIIYCFKKQKNICNGNCENCKVCKFK